MINPYPCLVIMCKRPKLYQGKQRLAATIGAKAALEIAELLLACAIEDAQQWLGEVVLAVAHEEDLAWAQSLMPAAQVIYQGLGNLGQRLNVIDQTLRASGQESLVFIGTDAPMLTQQHFLGLEELLAQYDIVLNNAEDGGVVIMSNSQPWPDLTKLAWSTDNLGEQLANCCRQHDLSVGYHTSGYDIDELADLERLYQDLVLDSRPARQALLEQSGQILKEKENNIYA